MKLILYVSSLAVVAWVGGNAFAQDTPPPLPPLPPLPKEESKPAKGGSKPNNSIDSIGAGAIGKPAKFVPKPVAPPDVVASAVTAVAALGNEVVLGRYQVALERMNPLWKERTANLMKGGIKELESKLAGVPQQMVQQGISMISFKPQGQPWSFEVGPGKKVEKINGAEVESLIFTKWLVMIPTVTKFRIMQKIEGQAPKMLTIDSIGFQVAIAEKGKNDWTFIDGSGLSVNDLRSIFVTLPQDLQFPPLEKRESR